MECNAADSELIDNASNIHRADGEHYASRLTAFSRLHGEWSVDTYHWIRWCGRLTTGESVGVAA